MKKMRLIFIVLVGMVCLLGLSGCIKKAQPVVVEETPPAVEAVQAVDPAVAAESDQYYEQGLQLYQQYKYPEAIIAFDQAIGISPENYKVYAAKGITLCFQGDYTGGKALIEKTLALQPDFLPAFYDMAMVCKLQRDYDNALLWFQKTIEGDSRNTWSYYGIATIYADQGKTKESLSYLGEAIALDPGVKAVARQQSHFAKMRSLTEFQELVR
ncbi:MAG: tetratricopeptide repeat protein [Syntrophomonadaceae bacterium]|nr:tetratricopeptide repeat protein [Syntrophomonadaceae bacterium]